MNYLKDVWYMAAWSHEVGAGGSIARTLLDIPVLLFRRSDSSPAAILDRCPHRFAPLSAGRVEGDRVICGYHGLGFDGAGVCVVNPHGPPLKNLAIPAFPVHEAHRGIWIWLGDAEGADPALIPDLGYLEAAPDTAFSCGGILARGNYEIFVDNIMDLSHTDFLHPTTLGGGAISRVQPTVEVENDHVDVTWTMRGAPPPPLVVKLLGNSAGDTDLITRVRWFPASVIRLSAATIPAGADESQGFVNLNAHILTPETGATSHYFFAATRNFRMDDAVLNATIAQIREEIFSTEDKPMIEKIQQRMGDGEFWSLKPRLLPIDEGPVRVRRKLKALIDAEYSRDRPDPTQAG